MDSDVVLDGNEVEKPDAVQPDDCDEIGEEDILQIQRDYHRQKLVETISGPCISLVIHIILLALLVLFVVGADRKPPVTIEVAIVEEEIVEIEEPEVLEQLEEVVEENVEADVPEAAERMFSEEDTQDLVAHDFSDDAPQTDDNMDTENVLDVIATNSPLKMTGMLGGRMNAGRGRGGKSGSGNGNSGLINDGLRWLASQQLPSGRWPFDAHPNAVSSAAALAFLGHGHSTRQGKYKHVVQKYVDFYCKNQRPDGGFGNHGHATPFVAMAMADALAMDPQNSQLRNFCERMLDYAIKTQHVDGGWSGGRRSTPKNKKEIDVGATGWWAMALFSYRLAGMNVPQENIDGIKTVLRQVANGAYDGEIITTSHGGLENSFNSDYTTGAYIATVLQFMGCPRNDPVVQRFSSQTRAKIPASGGRNYWVMYNLGMGLYQLGEGNPEWKAFQQTMQSEMTARKVTTSAGTYWENAAAFGRGGKGKKAGKGKNIGKADRGGGMQTSGNPRHWGRVGSTAMAILNLEVTHRYGNVHEYNSKPSTSEADTGSGSGSGSNIDDAGTGKGDAIIVIE